MPKTSYYHWLTQSLNYQRLKQAEDMLIRDEIEKIILEFNGYGYRPATAELRKREFIIKGEYVNHKRVLRIMKENSLLCQLKKQWIHTTDSNHNLLTYPNLIKEPKFIPTGINQLWSADITYIKLLTQFVYLAILLDVYSRKVIGWCLSEHLDHLLVLEALKMALRERGITNAGQKLVHHSDKGIQYCCREYTDLLKFHGIKISMSQKGAPWENGYIESFFKTLKTNEVYLNEYEDIYEAKDNIFNFIEKVYNQKRLHSSLNYESPDEFEKKLNFNNLSNSQTSLVSVQC